MAAQERCAKLLRICSGTGTMRGEIAGRYVVRGELGRGAGAVVYEALDRLLERRVAVKLVNLPSSDDPDTIERFRRGAKAAGRLIHPNIVSVFDYGEDAEYAWIVMELVEGGSLKAVLERERLPVPRTVLLMSQILDALGYSHGMGVVHRDIKPANIMLTSAGTAKITDFGIARLEDSQMTRVGTMIGTPAYMAPEQLRGETVDHRADIWAAGVVLYQMLTGERPFEGAVTSIMQKVLFTDPVPPSRTRAPAAGDFDPVVARALAKAPEDRFQTAAEFAAALRDVAATAVPMARAASPPLPMGDTTVLLGRASPPMAPSRSHAAPPRQREVRSRSRRLPILTACAAVLLAAGGGAWLFGAGRMPDADLPPDAAFLNRPADDAPVEPSTPSQEAAAQRPPAEPSPALSLAETPAPVGETPPPPSPPAPAVSPVALPTPAPVASGADSQMAADAAVAAAECGLLASTVEEGSISITGVVRGSEAEAVRRTLDAFGVPASATRLDLRTFDGPFCGLLPVIRPVAASPGEAPEVTLLSPDPLQGGQLLRFRVNTPDWNAHIHVAYVTETGIVGHLVHGSAAMHPPLASVSFGDPPRWAATEPYGTDLLIVLASDRPLFDQRRRPEPLADFLPALTSALRAVQQGGRVAARVVTIRTVARQ